MTFLSRDEIEELTGYKAGKRQCSWLAKNGYPFDVRADGRPALARSVFEARHTPARRRPSALNLAALDGMK
jgi:hypothetical protein